MGRPKLYADAAARQAAFRAEKSRVDVVVTKELGETLASISETLGTPKNDLVNSMIRFALTNHNWKKSGLWSVKK